MKIIKLTWVDSCSEYGWKDYSEGFKATIIESVGYLVAENDKVITISTSICERFTTAADPMTIPKCAIQKRRYVKI